jgi:hypothetical protein
VKPSSASQSTAGCRALFRVVRSLSTLSPWSPLATEASSYPGAVVDVDFVVQRQVFCPAKAGRATVGTEPSP